ncbi:MAG TPA: ATP-binding protein, partial [Thermomicrobiales bacterium]|nr:ATP-binding protein [Thermomicrobiales bacterium]
NALRSTREFQRQQARNLKQTIAMRDELIARSNELSDSATEARVAADEARLRLRVLADASWALTDMLDVRQTLSQLSDLLVPAITECLIVDLVDADTDTLDRALVACRDNAVGERIQAHPPCKIAELSDDHPLQHVLSTGHPTVLHGLDAGDFPWSTDACSFIDHAADFGLTACIIAPLRSRDRTIGTLTLTSTRPGHLYRPDDLQFAEDLALRTAQALDNAMLFQDVVQATKERERYLSMASHELRSPLAVVSGFGSLLLRYIENPELDRERILNVGREMQLGIERLEVLTNNLLASAEVDSQANGLQRRRADLVRVTRDVVERMKVTLPRTQRERLELSSTCPVFGHWNLESIERAITNVVSNALKYSSPDDTVHVDVIRVQDNAVVRVRDHGIGMTEAELADLFVPFARGKEARATAVGTGLGMYITQQIVRQHGGKVDVESTPGEGSVVTISLPLDLPHLDTPQPEPAIRRIK